MRESDIAWAPAHQLSDWLRDGELSASELVSACLDRIRRHDEKLHAFVSVYAEDALEAAKAAELARRAGHAVGPWHGVPVAIKDIVDMAGRITTGGSAVWRQRRSEVTATLVRRLTAAGMIVLGKTHTVEFAMGSWGTNEHLGTPWNPWDRSAARAPGGSSAGSAVSVAAGLSPWSIGTDTGGSVRIPAAYCGLTGLKTTIGRVSCHGVLPLSSTLDTPGPLCRDVKDAANLFDVLRGPDPQDRSTLGLPEYEPTACLSQRADGWVLGCLPASERDGVAAEVLNAYDQALDVWRTLGATIVEARVPVSFAELGQEVGRIIGAEGNSYVGDLVDDPALPIDSDVRPRIQLGKTLTARDYIELLRRKDAVTAGFEDAWTGLDAIVTPTAQSVAPPLADIDQGGTAAAFTRPFNYLGRCALAVPAGYSTAGLPLSVQVACAPYREDLALAIGDAYQSATDWHLKRPDGWD